MRDQTTSGRDCEPACNKVQMTTPAVSHDLWLHRPNARPSEYSYAARPSDRFEELWCAANYISQNVTEKVRMHRRRDA